MISAFTPFAFMLRCQINQVEGRVQENRRFLARVSRVAQGGGPGWWPARWPRWVHCTQSPKEMFARFKSAATALSAAAVVVASGMDVSHCDIQRIDIKRTDTRLTKRKGGNTLTPIQCVTVVCCLWLLKQALRVHMQALK